MKTLILQHRTKIVATIGPASSSVEVIRQMVQAGMSVARLNFSHGSYADHARTIEVLRAVSLEFDAPITLLQDLQGPKIRVGYLPNDAIPLADGEIVTLIPIAEYTERANTVGIDYPFLAEEVGLGAQILIDDGLLELRVDSIEGNAVHCRVVEGGILKSRKGVNLPSLEVRLPSMTEKDKQDLKFGIEQGVDWVSLSFVRRADDIRALKAFLKENGAKTTPAIAKIEKPQAILNLREIVAECDALMVARGDLGVEMSPEKVPMLQKQIIRLCNQQGIPVITATQMLDSMIHSPRPTRAEASDVANAIIDGTDAVMLSGESAVGKFPVKAVSMLAKIATDIEPEVEFTNYPPTDTSETHALSEALNTIDKVVPLRCITCFTTTGYTAFLAAAERPKAPVIAFTPSRDVYHRLNLVWGVKPLLIDHIEQTLEELIGTMMEMLRERQLAELGDKVLILGGSPLQKTHGTNFLKIHTIGE
jgi:pyruvate kinase